MKYKIYMLLMIGLFLVGKSKGQIYPDSTTVMTVPDKMPEYKTGMKGWTDFLVRYLDRDLLARQGAPAGKYTVIASFLVEADGSVSDIKIEFDRGYGTGDEVKRIINMTNKRWIPASDKGVPVPFRHRQSITFLQQ
jgi:protein TonB